MPQTQNVTSTVKSIVLQLEASGVKYHGTREMEDQRADNEQDDDDCKSHHTQTPPKTLGARSAVAVLMC